MNYQRPELRDALASEYVLGTLHGPARRRFQHLLKADPQLQAAVDFWQRQLMPMAAPLSAPQPSPKLWAGIAARVAPPSAASRSNWFERWFGVRSLASLVAGLFVGVAVTLSLPTADRGDGPAPSDTQIPASYAGILSDASGRPAMLVSSRRHGKLVDIKVLRPIGIGQGQVLRLWALGRQGPPLALGNVPAEGKGRIELPATSEALLAQVDELAVSVESAGVAPAVAPTFILRGPCAKFW